MSSLKEDELIHLLLLKIYLVENSSASETKDFVAEDDE